MDKPYHALFLSMIVVENRHITLNSSHGSYSGIAQDQMNDGSHHQNHGEAKLVTWRPSEPWAGTGVVQSFDVANADLASFDIVYICAGADFYGVRWPVVVESVAEPVV